MPVSHNWRAAMSVRFGGPTAPCVARTANCSACHPAHEDAAVDRRHDQVLELASLGTRQLSACRLASAGRL